MTHSRPAVVVRPVQSQQQLKEFRSVTAAYLVSTRRAWGFVLGADAVFQALAVANNGRTTSLKPYPMAQVAVLSPAAAATWSALLPCCWPPLVPHQAASLLSAPCQEWLGEDLSFQLIEAELASLPGSYAAEKRGAMLLAYAPAGGAAAAASDAGEGLECVGAVALRPLAGHTSTVPADGSVAGHPLADVCEMKRCVGPPELLLPSLLRQPSIPPHQGLCLGMVFLLSLAGSIPVFRRWFRRSPCRPKSRLKLPAPATCPGPPRPHPIHIALHPQPPSLTLPLAPGRLFVMPGHHGLGAGAALVRALLPAAAALGYRAMVLDTLERLEGANRLYRRRGAARGGAACEGRARGGGG